MDFADGTTVEFFVLVGRLSSGSLAVYDTAQYDLDVYDGSNDLSWTNVAEQASSVETRRGKDAFNKRYRTGTGTIMLDNSEGQFTTDLAQPGDFVWIRALVYTPGGLPPTPIPDQTTWQDSTGRDWTAQGTGLILQGEAGGYFDYSLFYGRIDSALDVVKGGVDYTKLRIVDMLAGLAMYDGEAEVSQGAAEFADDRVRRWLAKQGGNYTVDTDGSAFKATMQATTLAGQTLSGIQLTSDSEGGDLWADPDIGLGGTAGGRIQLRGRDWLTEQPRSTTIQYTLGFNDLELTNGRIDRNLELVYNDVTYASVGGTAQNTKDDESIARYGHRTYRRLDLICGGDAQPAYLAARLVAERKSYRPQVRDVTVNVESAEYVAFAHGVQFGDLVLVNIKSMHGWSQAFLAHVRAIEHTLWHDQWEVTIGLSTLTDDNVDGDFDYQAFGAGFSLGGQP